jgi:ribose 5-phosphate isomerase RpiB
MRIAIVSEVSAVDRNPALVDALAGRGHELCNVGMISSASPALTYLHTGLIGALLLNAGRADLVVGGCGTGQGFLCSVTQYPGVFAGLLLDSLDAWLFRRINAGNCISLALNKGYGWAGEVNLRMLFDRFFEAGEGTGYPAARSESQAASRGMLRTISGHAHRSMPDILKRLDDSVVMPALAFPGVWETINPSTLADGELRAALRARRKE